MRQFQLHVFIALVSVESRVICDNSEKPKSKKRKKKGIDIKLKIVEDC